jgi:hypothetical protein
LFHSCAAGAAVPLRMWLTKQLTYVLFWLQILVLMLVSAILFWRRAYRHLPLFFVYVLSAWLVGIVRYAAFKLGPQPYFYVYWISELAGVVTVSLVFYEVFLRRLFPRFYKVRFYRNLFPAIAIAILFLTIITALQASDKRAAFSAASHAFDFVRTAVLFFFVILMTLMGREWPRYDFGIALGFGLHAAVALVHFAVRTQFHDKPAILDVMDMVAYDLACFIWLITFLKPEKSPPQLPPDRLSVETLDQARKWEDTVKDLLIPGKHSGR